MVYRSSHDPRVLAPRAAAAVLIVLLGATLVTTAEDFGRTWLGVLVVGAVLMLLGLGRLASALYVRYALDPFELVLHRGLMRTRIPLECIEGVLPVGVPADAARVAAPHLTIVYQKGGRAGTAVLTPDDPDAFLADLARQAPFLERAGERLLRKPGLLATR